jgi:hypothetical protein
VTAVSGRKATAGEESFAWWLGVKESGGGWRLGSRGVRVFRKILHIQEGTSRRVELEGTLGSGEPTGACLPIPYHGSRALAAIASFEGMTGSVKF